jgi:putative glutathione S-transferase
MANLVAGKISHDPIAKVSKSGEFQRPDSHFRGTIVRADAVPGRFHLYVSYACPWAHRTLIMRNLKNLQNFVNVSVSEAFMGDEGWMFKDPKDPKYLAVLYVASEKNYTGKISVPVLWDTRRKVILNNESSEIIRIFNSAYDHLTGSQIDLYPDDLKDKIDAINDKIYPNVNNGVYRTGFASSQKAYEESFKTLFETLDELDTLLGKQAFLTGEYFTEADIRLFTTLIRFDAVYVGHFKCNKKRIADYENLNNYLKSIYQHEDIRSTCHFDHIKEHYYQSHKWINPTGIVPRGPELDLESSHNRGPLKIFLKKNAQVELRNF